MPTLNPTDSELATRTRQGDSAAFDALVVRYYQPLLDLVTRYVKSVDVAEDVLQDMFVRLWDRRLSWNVPESVRGYLYTTARNAALNMIRQTETRLRLETQSASLFSTDRELEPTDRIEQEEFATAVQHAIDGLPDRGREIYILAYQHRLSYQEISQMLGIAIPTVKTHMARTLQTLERRLRRFLLMILVG